MQVITIKELIELELFCLRKEQQYFNDGHWLSQLFWLEKTQLMNTLQATVWEISWCFQLEQVRLPELLCCLTFIQLAHNSVRLLHMHDLLLIIYLKGVQSIS